LNIFSWLQLLSFWSVLFLWQQIGKQSLAKRKIMYIKEQKKCLRKFILFCFVLGEDSSISYCLLIICATPSFIYFSSSQSEIPLQCPKGNTMCPSKQGDPSQPQAWPGKPVDPNHNLLMDRCEICILDAGKRALVQNLLKFIRLAKM
jgi:hypothetical protein